MAKLVVNTALLKCSFGMAPSTFIVLPAGRPLVGMQPAANIMDFIPFTNILPFAMCQSPANPMVAAATAAAMGVLTPQPCIPATTAPWFPGATASMVAMVPALTDSCKCMCMWAGMIEVTSPGQFVMDVS